MDLGPTAPLPFLDLGPTAALPCLEVTCPDRCLIPLLNCTVNRLTWVGKTDFTKEFLFTRGVLRPHGLLFKTIPIPA